MPRSGCFEASLEALGAGGGGWLRQRSYLCTHLAVPVLPLGPTPGELAPHSGSERAREGIGPLPLGRWVQTGGSVPGLGCPGNISRGAGWVRRGLRGAGATPSGGPGRPRGSCGRSCGRGWSPAGRGFAAAIASHFPDAISPRPAGPGRARKLRRSLGHGGAALGRAGHHPQPQPGQAPAQE